MERKSVTPEQVRAMTDALTISGEASPELLDELDNLFFRVKGMLPHYAVITWSPGDLEDEHCFPDATDEQRTEWMREYGRKVVDANMEPGWSILRTLVLDYPLEDMDNG